MAQRNRTRKNRTRTRKNRTRTRKNRTRTRKNRTRKQRGGAEGIDQLTEKLNRREETLEYLTNEGLPTKTVQADIAELRKRIALLQAKNDGPTVEIKNISSSKVFSMKISEIKKLNEETFMNKISEGLGINKENIGSVIKGGKRLGSNLSFQELKETLTEKESIHVIMKLSPTELMFKFQPEPEPEPQLNPFISSSDQSKAIPPEKRSEMFIPWLDKSKGIPPEPKPQSKPMVEKAFNKATFVQPGSKEEKERMRLIVEESKKEAEKKRLERLEELRKHKDEQDKLIRQEAQKVVDNGIEKGHPLEKIAFDNKGNDRVLQRLALHVVKTELDEINERAKSNMEIVLTLTNKNEELLKDLMASNYFHIKRPDEVELLGEILEQFRNMPNPDESQDDSSYEFPSGLLEGLSDNLYNSKLSSSEIERRLEKLHYD